MKRIVARFILVLTLVFSLVSGCQCVGHDPDLLGYKNVLILYSAGYNSLRDYLYEDIQELKEGYAPGIQDKNVFLVVSHLAKSRGDYSTVTYPQLIRVYQDKVRKEIVFDTLKTYTDGNLLTRKDDMNAVLSDIRQQFKAEHYGMVFSSHASGWVPSGYYNHPSYFDYSSSAPRRSASRTVLPSGAVPYREPEEFHGAPAVKSLGICNQVESGETVSYEMDIQDFAEAIPMHFDYILMDACLAGGVEVAYELREKCDRIGFSQAEILADGFNYKNLASRLLEGLTPEPEAVLEDYYRQYAEKTSSDDRAATISLVDCTKLDDLASLCGTLFEKYRESIASLDPDTVQRFYRSSHHWFYDLEDILVKAGIDSDEKSNLKSALDGCIVYKAATEEFLKYYGGFTINAFSGLTMFLPCNGSAYLKAFYKNLAWNKATLLVD